PAARGPDRQRPQPRVPAALPVEPGPEHRPRAPAGSECAERAAGVAASKGSMNMRPPCHPAGLLACLAATLLASASRGQSDKSEGSVMVVPQGFVVDPATAIPGGPGTLFFTSADFSDVAPPTWVPSPGVPDWSMMLSGLPLGIDGFSIGFDYIQ